MKILFLNDEYPPYSCGGAAVAAERLAEKFASEGHEVFVATTNQNQELRITNYECHPELVSGSHGNYHKIPLSPRAVGSAFVATSAKEAIAFGDVRPFPKGENSNKMLKQSQNDIKVYRIISNYNLRWRAWKSMYNKQVMPELRKIIAEIRPDVAHAHNIHTYLSYASLKLARQYSKAVFLTAHDVMLFSYDKIGRNAGENDSNDAYNFKMNFWQRIKQAKKRFNPFRELAIKHYMKNVDMIFAISNIQKKALAENGFKRATVVANGIDIDSFSVGLGEINDFKQKFGLHNKKIIFYGGRLSGAKGADLAVQYLAEVRKQVRNAALIVAGKKEAYERIIAPLARKMGLSDNIISLGWMDKEELKKVFGAADVCITPSRYFDPFNLFNIEAMAAKKPVVGTCLGGTPEIIADGRTGYVVNPLKIQEYADKIAYLLQNDELAKEMGKNGYNRAKELFSIEKQYKETLAWYERFA